jgi:two-component system response regulator HydG
MTASANLLIEPAPFTQKLREGAKPERVKRSDNSVARKARGLVLVADDDASTRGGLATLLKREGFDVALAEDGVQALASLQELAPDVLVVDLRIPGLDGIELLRCARELRPESIVVLLTTLADVDTAVRAMREGAEQYLNKPLQFEELAVVIERALERCKLRRETTELRARLREKLRFDNIIGASPSMQEMFHIIEQVAPTKANVLLSGESGTGKELVAQAIHEHSPRASGPFVKLHCAAVAESVLESELFGHEKGALRGGVGRREGRLKRANGGSLFLDEVGNLSASTQNKLFRFLKKRLFERVGGSEAIQVDVRIISATNRDLRGQVAAGRFREDLLSLLNVANVEIPALRARPGDILPLAIHFLRRFAKESRKAIEGFDEGAVERLASYRWPGNVRELENVLERAVVLCHGKHVTTKHLPVGVGVTPRGVIRIPGSTLAELERHAILTTLDATGGCTAQAARMLQISVRKIQYKLHDYGVAMGRSGGAIR